VALFDSWTSTQPQPWLPTIMKGQKRKKMQKAFIEIKEIKTMNLNYPWVALA